MKRYPATCGCLFIVLLRRQGSSKQLKINLSDYKNRRGCKFEGDVISAPFSMRDATVSLDMSSQERLARELMVDRVTDAGQKNVLRVNNKSMYIFRHLTNCTAAKISTMIGVIENCLHTHNSRRLFR